MNKRGKLTIAPISAEAEQATSATLRRDGTFDASPLSIRRPNNDADMTHSRPESAGDQPDYPAHSACLIRADRARIGPKGGLATVSPNWNVSRLL